jgi:hypothetical protein
MISLSRFHDRQLPRCVLPTTATHYLTNCTRARGFPGSVLWFKDFDLATVSLEPSQPRRSMRFTTPSIASAGESVFASEKYSFPKPEFPSPLLLSSPVSALRFHPFGWLSELSQVNSETLRFRLFRAPSEQRSFERALPAERRIERLVCSSSREGDANAAIRKQVPEM